MATPRRAALVLAVAAATVLASARGAAGAPEGRRVAAPELTLSVAISLKGAVEEVGALFTRTHPAARLHLNLGASGALEKQIEAGAPVDVFLSAGRREMDALAKAGLIRADTRRVFAKNVLVVVVPTASRLAVRAPEDLAGPGVRHVATGDPRTVPAGQYAAESVERLGLAARLRPRLVLAENVRQVLDWVARDEVDAGFVYATDVAAGGGRVREAFRLPASSHEPIVYPAAVVAGSAHPALAVAFLDLLTGADGQAVLRRHGFEPPGATS